MEKITENISRIDRLRKDRTLPREEMRLLLTTLTKEEEAWLCKNADEVRREHYGTDVYLRGLIEFTNYCRNDCLYCGIRRSNRNARRYRLTTEEILDCSDKGYLLGFRTIVLQGGEDLFFTDEKICSLVSEIKKRHPDCAVTLSIGERPRESYEAFFAAGADRYLLRHETINPVHYSLLHPRELTIENRVRCLKDLREIGFQVGCGMMVGSPYQTVDYLLDDLYFMAEFKPHMIGIGPFIPHGDTPFCDRESGTLEDTLHLLAIIRLMNPRVLLPWAFRRAPMSSCPTFPRPVSVTNTCSTTARSAPATKPRSAGAVWSSEWKRSAITLFRHAVTPGCRRRLRI